MWTICHECQGQGKINRGLSKKAQRLYKTELALYENKQSNTAPIRPKAHLHLCTNCSGSGLMQSENYLEPISQNRTLPLLAQVLAELI